MPSINYVSQGGHLTRDIELKYIQSGTAVTNMGLAVNNRIKRNEEWVDEPVFMDVTLWGKNAERAAEHLRKGSFALVEGKLKLDQWEDANGNRRSKLSVVADKLHFFPDKNRSSQEGGRFDPMERDEAPF